MPQLTTEQLAAIECRQHSVALSAGAGCGKTFVLTERFLSHLDSASYGDSQQTHLSQLIAITFTDAAAREMRSRIRTACYDRLQQAATHEHQQLWLRHLREIDSARISTIHAFCTTLLRSNAAQAGLDPTFGVLDQADADVLQYEVIDDVLRQELAELSGATLDLAASYSLRQLKEQIAELLSYRRDPAFEAYQTETPENLVARWRAWHTTHALPNAIGEIAMADSIGTIHQLLALLGSPPRNEKFRDCRAMLLDRLPRLIDLDPSLNEADLDAIRAAAMIRGVCTAKDWPNGHYEEYRDACKALRDQIDKHRPGPFIDSLALEAARLGIELLKLAAQVSAEYEERKRTLGQLDFDDLLVHAYTLISSPDQADLAQRLAEDLRLLLVDEFQDTDQLQTELVTKLCGSGFDAGRLFFVGDYKQSIYRFRGAAPDVFRKLSESVHERGRLRLVENYRSQPEILYFVNALFCNAFTRGLETYEQLVPKRQQVAAAPAVEFLWTITPNKHNKRMAGAARDARICEAQIIAKRLCALLDEASEEKPVVDKTTKEPRRLQYGDVAILFRSLSDVQYYEKALRDAGLDYYLVGGHAFYAQQEIFDVLNLLRAVASTADEASLAGALRSPFFSLEDETLFWLADTAGSLNAGLTASKPPSQLSPTEAAKVVAAAATLAHLRSIKDRVPIATLLGVALDRTGFDAVVLAEFLGQRKLANLHKLVERARLVDQGGAIDLDGFITQLSQFVSREPRESLAATLPEAANVIRLMTIHHAKGLEFPFVIIPDLDRPPNLQTPAASIHAELGPLVRQPADDDNDKSVTGMTLYSAIERYAELEERKRLLYVATTRAADHLILSSSLEATDKPKSDWMKLLAECFNLASGELRMPIPEDYKAPTIGVVINEPTATKPGGNSHGPDLVKLLDDAHEIAASGKALIPLGVAPVPVDQAAQHQFSFSRLTGHLLRSPTKPREAAAGTIDEEANKAAARGLGSLVHDVLERIDFANPKDVCEWCEHLAPNHVFQNVEHVVERASTMIERFLQSPRGQQLAAAQQVHREVDFLLAWPPGGINTAGRYVQGVIDCLYQDAAGAWYISDFKTNDVRRAGIAHEAKRYALQLHVYAMALEATLGQPPKELVLHFLRPEAEYIVAWSKAIREQTIATMNELIFGATHSTNQINEL